MKHRNTQNGSKSTNHKPWPSELDQVNKCFLGCLLKQKTLLKLKINTKKLLQKNDKQKTASAFRFSFYVQINTKKKKKEK